MGDEGIIIDEAAPMLTPFDQGRQAFRMRVKLAGNPYKRPERTEWANGWKLEYREAK